MTKIKVLLVEDEATLAMIIKDTLEIEGFEVATAEDGQVGLTMMPQFKPDVLVADIMMPQMDGFEMVRHIRLHDRHTPVLFLSARSAIDDVVEGFELGADDYLKKPFSMKELVVRLRALVQRASLNQPQSESAPTPSLISIGQFSLNPVTQQLARYGQAEELSNRESEILRLLASRENDVVTTKEILLSLWGDDSPYNAKSLQVFITKLRHRLSKDDSIRILNVRGIGYKLIFGHSSL